MPKTDHELLENLGAHRPEITGQTGVSSSPCMVGDTDPAYHGFTPLETLIEQLNTLLEAERAGALVCAKSLKEAPDEITRRLLESLRECETRSCRGLLHSLQVLGATASKNIGAFHDKAMSITDMHARLHYLLRGQQWIENHINEWLPGVANAQVHAQLLAMRDDHVEGIAALLQHEDVAE